MRKIFRVVLGSLALCISLGMGGVLVMYHLNSPPTTLSGQEQEFTIFRGESVYSIAERLEREGFIRSKEFLIWISKWKGTESRYQAGYYSLPFGKTALEIHDLLVKGMQILFRVTIPEGWTRTRMAKQLEALGITPETEFLSATQNEELLSRFGIPAPHLEGFLFPETYHFPKDYPASKVVQTMVETFFRKTSSLLPEGELPKGKELYEKVILASIIEREYRDPEEAPLIASVFYNRLKIRMPLGSCATVEYVLTQELGRPHPEFLTYQDLEVDSPYNTYKRQGLPPGPIGNPGTVALRAAFFPADTDFRYFVLKDPNAGRHFFSRTLQEHNQAKVVYLKRIQSGS
ncbi:MAG: endolytic transglycosylase MltG [Spirochaetales bacterium]